MQSGSFAPCCKKTDISEVRIKDYYDLFVKLSLQQCTENDYADKAKVRRHNAAFKKLYKLQDETKRNMSEEALLILLNHEDDRVKVNAASFCLQWGILVGQSVQTLKKAADTSGDRTIRLSAEMLPQKYQ